MMPMTLMPLSSPHHVALLQAIYDATPDYWRLYGLSGAPLGRARHDLDAANATPGRTIMGVLRRVNADEPATGMEMIGMIDIRLHYPTERTVSMGLLMIAEPCQRQGVGRQAWSLLEAWLAQSGGMTNARAAVEQFNIAGLKFLLCLGFNLTGEANRLRVGDRLIRLLALKKTIVNASMEKI
jgi:ribosomal protein S18 acetylase RimI-like enzyme